MGTEPTRAEQARQLAGEGARLLALHRPGEAVVKLLEARKLNPHDVPAAINLGGAYIMQGKHARAIPILESAALLEPDNVMIWSNLAAAYLGKLPLATTAQQDKAIGAYERALSLDPGTPHAHYNLGLIYLERNDRQRAAAHFHRAVETDPSDRDAHYFLAKIQREEYDQTEGQS